MPAGDARSPPPAGRTPGARTRTAAARWRAPPRRAARRTWPPCPAAAPQASRILRSDGETWSTWPSERAERAAGDDDRPLGAERAAGADGDRGRQRLGDAPCAARCGSACVSTASIASGMPWPRMIGDHLASPATASPPSTGAITRRGDGSRCGTTAASSRPPEQGQVGEQGDQVDQGVGGEPGQRADEGRQQAQQQEPPGGAREGDPSSYDIGCRCRFRPGAGGPVPFLASNRERRVSCGG